MKYLLDEHPITFYKSLAMAIGINEAIILQYIHFWLSSKQTKNKEVWMYKTYSEMQVELPFFSESTIKRTIKKLMELKVLQKKNLNKSKIDKTNWYMIDYKILSEICGVKMELSEYQNDTSIVSNWNDGECQNDTTNTIDYTLNTTLVKENIKESSENLSNLEAYKEIVNYMNVVNEHHRFNVKIPFSYKYQSKATQKLINARLREGYNVEEFKDVIWWGYKKFVENEFTTQNGESSFKYFRPSTLFSSEHFEAYLNEYRANTQ